MLLSGSSRLSLMPSQGLVLPSPESSWCLAALHLSRELEELDLGTNEIGDKGAKAATEAACQLPKLRLLNINGNAISRARRAARSSTCWGRGAAGGRACWGRWTRTRTERRTRSERL